MKSHLIIFILQNDAADGGPIRPSDSVMMEQLVESKYVRMFVCSHLSDIAVLLLPSQHTPPQQEGFRCPAGRQRF